MLAWIDFRNATGSPPNLIPDIWGAVLGVGEFPIAEGPPDQRAATIDLDYVRTNQAVVSWIDNRVTGNDFDIFRAQVDQSGVVSGETLVVGQPGVEERGPLAKYSDVGGVDNGYLLIWRDDRSGVDFDLFGTKVFP